MPSAVGSITSEKKIGFLFLKFYNLREYYEKNYTSHLHANNF